MSGSNERISMIDMFIHPVFCVKNGIVTKANQPALQHAVEIGKNVLEMITAGKDEYANFSGICLSVTLCPDKHPYVATVFRNEGEDIFHLQPDYTDANLRGLALAAQQLRGPLASALISAEQLSDTADDSIQNQLGQINRSLYQILRAVNNMSDAGSYSAVYGNTPENTNLTAVVSEIMERAAELAEQAGRVLVYQIPNRDVYCLADRNSLERGIYNMLSNAIKHSPKGSEIRAKLTFSDNKFYFSTENECPDLNSSQISNLFSRYLREPGIEDGRHGMGLGIKMIQSAASAHNGTLLIDRPDDKSVRFTLSAPIRPCKNINVKNNLQTILPGGYDNALIELSDVLPGSAFKNPF